ncbi:MAG: NTP transferase domain-containing protein [Myxococcales bacterium]|nr:NTP transferase domain-containing protein [Myxococcales bacterium]
MTTKRVSHAVIMAAGRGRRMAPLTDALPKPMAPYLDSTLIAHGIAKVRKFVPNIHVTVGYKGAMLAHHLVEIGVASIFTTEGHSNAWWIANTLLAHLDEPVFVLTSDNVTDLDFDELAEDYFAQGAPIGMLVPVKPVEGLDGDFIIHEKGRVTSLDRNTPSDIYCSGIQILNPARVNAIAKLQETDDFYAVWNAMMARGELRVSNVLPKKWFSVDTLVDLARVREEHEKG